MRALLRRGAPATHRCGSRTSPRLPPTRSCRAARGETRSRRAPISFAAEHREPDLLLGDIGRELGHDLAFVEDEDPVGEGQDLVQLEGDEKDRASLVTLLDEAPVNELDRTDVE